MIWWPHIATNNVPGEMFPNQKEIKTGNGSGLDMNILEKSQTDICVQAI